MILAVATSLIALTRVKAASLERTYTISLAYADQADPGRSINAGIALRQMQNFLDDNPPVSGMDYSFVHDVLGDALPKSLRYVDSGHGYGEGINIAASALNTLVHKVFYWSRDGIERPLFEQVHAVPIKNDTTLGVYAVAIFLAPFGTEDYVWHLNPDYRGAAPHITGNLDASAITLTVTYSDESAPNLSRATLTESLRALIGDRRIGVSVMPVAHPELSISIHDDYQVPIASAWKGPGLIYCFANSKPDVWLSMPVKYWSAGNLSEVPAQYQKAWLQNHTLLHDVYIMAVYSGNHEAGNVLAYVYRTAPHAPGAGGISNPIRAFNDWSQQVVGISAASGMYNWHYGDLMNADIFDERYAKRKLTINNNELFYANTFSARDLALFYLFLATKGKTQGFYDTAVELLSIRNEIVSKIEGQAPPDLQTATKDGYFGPGSPQSLGHDVNNDAGLLIFPDGRVYVAAFTAFDAVELESDVVGLLIRSLVDDPGLMSS